MEVIKSWGVLARKQSLARKQAWSKGLPSESFGVRRFLSIQDGLEGFAGCSTGSAADSALDYAYNAEVQTVRATDKEQRAEVHELGIASNCLGIGEYGGGGELGRLRAAPGTQEATEWSVSRSLLGALSLIMVGTTGWLFFQQLGGFDRRRWVEVSTLGEAPKGHGRSLLRPLMGPCQRRRVAQRGLVEMGERRACARCPPAVSQPTIDRNWKPMP